MSDSRLGVSITEASADECYYIGMLHAERNLPKEPWADWTQHQQDAYNAGYDSKKEPTP